MSSILHENPNPNPNFLHQTPPNPQPPLLLLLRRCKSLWLPSLLVLLLSLLLSISSPKLNPFRHSLNTHLHPQPHKALRNSPPSPRPPCVLWMAPFLSPGGYSSEAWSYITSLSKLAHAINFTLKLHHHGDLESLEFFDGLPEESKALLYNHYYSINPSECPLGDAIVICHSEPGAWFPSKFKTLPCPPTGYSQPLFVVGRTMFETDRLNAEHAERCNQMDAIWVPTEFHVSTFIHSGVDRSKLVKLVQPVDVEFFDPSKHSALALDALMKPVLGSREGGEFKFTFLSVFKWEHRKGWDVLLKAFLEEFSNSDNVALCMLVSAYHTDTQFGAKILNFVRKAGLQEPESGWAAVYVIGSHIAQTDLPRLYKAADALVLPTRGEGWGRPIVEAMSMALPVIATNWSGPTEYMTEENGYPLPVDEMSEVADGPFKGHMWAEPSSERLGVLMRRVEREEEERREKGRKAREDMIERFSPEVVGRILAGQIGNIVKKKRSYDN